MKEKAAENVPRGDIISIANQRQHLAIFSDVWQTFFWFGAGEEQRDTPQRERPFVKET